MKDEESSVNEELRMKNEELATSNKDSSFRGEAIILHSSLKEGSSLKEKTAKGLFWGGFSNGLQQLLNLLFGIFLARLLTRDDYGMVGMLAIFTQIASTLQEGGFISALTKQRIFKVLETAKRVYDNRHRRVSTAKLNEVMLPIIENYPPPAWKGK